MKGIVKCFIAALVLTGCNAGKDQTNIELIQDMMDQPSLKAQDWDQRRGGEKAVRVPPEGTVPKGFKPYAYSGEPIKANDQLKNPMAGDFSPQVMEEGKEAYRVYCSVCHGAKGDGKGPVAEKMTIKPPSLLTDKIRNTYKDGRIYHVITDGQGVMGNYATQIRESKTRWAVVNYVRNLQKRSE